MTKDNQQKLWCLGFAHLIAIPIALAADSGVGIVYCVIVSGGALLMLRAFGVR